MRIRNPLYLWSELGGGNAGRSDEDGIDGSPLWRKQRRRRLQTINGWTVSCSRDVIGHCVNVTCRVPQMGVDMTVSWRDRNGADGRRRCMGGINGSREGMYRVDEKHKEGHDENGGEDEFHIHLNRLAQFVH